MKHLLLILPLVIGAVSRSDTPTVPAPNGTAKKVAGEVSGPPASKFITHRGSTVNHSSAVMASSTYQYVTSPESLTYLTKICGYKLVQVECYVFTEPGARPDLIPVYAFQKINDGYWCATGDTYLTTQKSDGDKLKDKRYAFMGVQFYVRRPKVHLGERSKEKDKWGYLYRMWSNEDGVLNHYYTRVTDRTKRKNRGYKDSGHIGQVILAPAGSPLLSEAKPLYKIVKRL